MSQQRRESVPPIRRPDVGMTTAEYAVGTIGAASIALVLVRVVGDGTFLELVRPFLEISLSFDWSDFPRPDRMPLVRPFRGLL